jgi:hypothetical protein
MVGLAHLARLLAGPGREIHVADLVAAAYEGRREAAASAGESLPSARVAGDAGELIDRKARDAYEARLREAREELAEAIRLNDRGHVELLAEEVERITAELARGFGLGGRSRRAGSSTERARVAVLRAIKYAIDKLAEHDAELAEHLRLSVRTGTFCVYDPPSRDALRWTVESPD